MHGTNSPIHPTYADAMKFYATDRVKAILEDDGETLEGTVIRKHASEGWYWVRFQDRFAGHCLPLRWNQLTRIVL